ncbi:MAG TPA: hypothetical protein VIM29_03830 [Bacillota bacterium]
MKRLTVLLSVIILVLTLATNALAGTIGVNVGEGYSVSLQNENLDYDSYKITGNIGISSQTLLWLSYATESEKDADDATTSFGLRYEFINNFAGTFQYDYSEKKNAFTLGLRAKKDLLEPVALVGKAEYSSIEPENADSYTGYHLTGQVEYAFNEYLTANLGVAYLDYDLKGYDATTKLLAGLEFYPTDQLTCWIDYCKDEDSDVDDIIGVGVEFKF